MVMYVMVGFQKKFFLQSTKKKKENIYAQPNVKRKC